MQFYNPGQTMNALAAGAQLGQGMRRNRQQNALASAMKGGDYAAAANAAYDMGDISGGMQLMQYNQQQAEDARTKPIKQGMLFAQNMLQIPAQQRGEWAARNWGEIAPLMGGMDFESFLAQNGVEAFSDAELQADIALARTQLGMGPPEREYTAETDALGRPVAFDKSTGQFGQPFGEVKPQSAGSTMGKLAQDLANGLITQEQYDTAVAKMTRDEPGLSIQIGEGGALSGITYGTANKGQDSAIVRGEDGSARVSPGPQQQLYNKARGALQSYETTNELVLEDIDRAVQMAGTFTTGLPGAALERIPGTPAYDMSKILDSVKANIGFDKLQDMRDNSPTGGALGQVSEWELQLLQSVLGSLEQAQTREQFIYNLNRIKEIKQEGARRRREAFAQDFPTLMETAEFRAGANRQVGALQGLTAPDGSPVSEDDIQETMRANNMSREEVIARLRGQ